MSATDDRHLPISPLTGHPEPAVPKPAEEPPASSAEREETWTADHTPLTRDTTPALGTPGQAGRWERAVRDAAVALQRPGWADAAWSFLYKADTRYASRPADARKVSAANRRMREGEMARVHGPIINQPVWTWEVPLYFWFGGMAAGASFVGLACDLAGDHRSARIARGVAVAAVMPSPPLLILDLGRPGRFLNMLRIFKPRSPMNTGAWSLMAFSLLGTAAVGADLVRLRRTARVLGGVNAVVGGYLGSYTGVLLATTAVPVWARSRLFLGPIFVCTGAATGAAATRLTLDAAGLPGGHPTRTALGRVETGAILAELVLAQVNEHRLGRAGQSLDMGPPAKLFTAAKWLVRASLALRATGDRLGARAPQAASVGTMAGALCFRYAWVTAGQSSARDDVGVARMARGQVTVDDEVLTGPRGPRMQSRHRRPVPVPGQGVYAEVVRRVSLVADRIVPRHGHGSPEPGGSVAPREGGSRATFG